MHFSSWAVCSLLLATLSPQVFSVQTQVVITGSGDVIKGGTAQRTGKGDVIEPARRRRTTTKVVTITTGLHLDFGGPHHGDDKHGHKMRPEALKMQVCEEPSSKCIECTTQASCWRGTCPECTTGRLKLDVPASASFNNYAAEMRASCVGIGAVYVQVFEDGLVNGVLMIFVDGSLRRTISKAKESVKTTVAIRKSTHVRVVFVRSTAGQKASGFISLHAKAFDEHVDVCMSVTNCLVSLGDGTDSAFLFRNSNEKQYACLDANSIGERDAVSDHCNPWATCLSSSGIKLRLKALLGAALTPRGSLAEGETNIQKLNDAEGCVDPSVEDPESWDCECVDKMTASCDGRDDNEECFNEILCKNTNVCESWKDAHCADLLLAKQNISIKAPQTKSAALTRRGVQRAIATVDDRLDSALSGKCSQ